MTMRHEFGLDQFGRILGIFGCFYFLRPMLILEQPQFVFVLDLPFLFFSLYIIQARMSPEQRFRRLLSPPLTPFLPEVEHFNIRV